MNFTPQQVARKIAAAASDKKAKDILLLNMENKPFPADRLFCNCQCR